MIREYYHNANRSYLHFARRFCRWPAIAPTSAGGFSYCVITGAGAGAGAGARLSVKERLRPVYALFPDLQRQHKLLAGHLSGGQRQMLAVARALIAQPTVLVLDEPSAGLSPKLVGQVLGLLRQVRDTGVTVVLVEQNVKAALTVADRAVVLVEGRERIVGSSAELLRDTTLADLYLGRHAQRREATPQGLA